MSSDLVIESPTPHPRPKRMVCCGESGAGKTSIAIPLAKAGYKVGLVDVEGKTQPLDESIDPDVLERVVIARCAGRGYDGVREAMGRLVTDDSIDIIILDSFSRLGGDLSYLDNDPHGSTYKEAMVAWQTIGRVLVKLLYSTTRAKKHIIMLIHLDMVQDKDGNVRPQPRVAGNMARKEFDDKFDAIWTLKADIDPGKASKRSFYVHTKPVEGKIYAKTVLPRHLFDKMPDMFPADDFGKMFREYVVRDNAGTATGTPQKGKKA